MKLSELLSISTIVPDLKSTSKEDVFEEMAGMITRNFPELDKNEIISALLEREKLGSTGIEYGIAVPHAKLKDINSIIIAVGRSRDGIEFQAHDGKLSNFFFVLLSPDSSAGLHLKTLGVLSRIFRNEDVRKKLMDASSAEDIYNIVRTADESLKGVSEH